MNTNKQSSNRNHRKEEKDSSGIMKFFYLVMFLLIGSSSVIGIAGISHRNANAQSAATPVSNNPPIGGETSALVLVFHREDSGSGKCVDLTITSTGTAVYSDCSNGVNMRYTLSASEQAQVQDWIKQFQQINDQTQSGQVITKIYLNGQGNQPPNNTATQQLIYFATALIAKIAAMS